MKSFTERIQQSFHDEEVRSIYADEFLNTSIATQIKVLREARNWTQKELAERAEMKQERISVMENVDYSSWSINSLRRLARAFDLRLKVQFEEFGTFATDFEGLSRESLQRRSFSDDPVFMDNALSDTATSEEAIPTIAA